MSMATPPDSDNQIIVSEIRRFVDREVLPVARDLPRCTTGGAMRGV